MSKTTQLERCADCAHVQYPSRGFCAQCLSPNVRTDPVGDAGRLVSWTTLQTSLEPALRQHLPLTIASVKLDEGPVVIAYFNGQPDKVGQSVNIALVADPAGTPMLVAQSHTDATPPETFLTAR